MLPVVVTVEVAAVVNVVRELVVVLAEDMYPTVVVVMSEPDGIVIFPILFPTSSVKNTLNVPSSLIGDVCNPPPQSACHSLGVRAIPYGFEAVVGTTYSWNTFVPGMYFPIILFALSVNHRLLSVSFAMYSGSFPGECTGRGISVITPDQGWSFAILSPSFWVNQTKLCGVTVIPHGVPLVEYSTISPVSELSLPTLSLPDMVNQI